MKKLLIILLFPVIFYSNSYAQTEDEYKKTLKELFMISGSEENYQAAIKQMTSMFKQKQTNVREEIWCELETEFSKTSIINLVDMLTPVYKKYMSLEDLNEMIKFYQTPIGQKFLKNNSQIMLESMQVGLEWGMKLGEEIVKKLKDKGY